MLDALSSSIHVALSSLVLHSRSYVLSSLVFAMIYALYSSIHNANAL